jgi:hypothetical protein
LFIQGCAAEGATVAPLRGPAGRGGSAVKGDGDRSRLVPTVESGCIDLLRVLRGDGCSPLFLGVGVPPRCRRCVDILNIQ